jgi:DNA primase large subunit
VHLQKPGGAMIDSTLHIDAHDSLVFVRADSTEMPYIAFIRLINPKDAMDWLELPVAIEEGQVDIDLGEVVKLSGTKTNKNLQQFLNEREKMREELNPSTDDVQAALDEIANTYSAFYAKHILKNADNVLGRFVYKAYGAHLNKADREKVEAKMGKQQAS